MKEVYLQQIRKEQEEGGMFLGRDHVSVTVPEKSACHCRFWTLYTSWSANRQKHSRRCNQAKITKTNVLSEKRDAQHLLPVQLSSSLWSEQSKKPSHLSLSRRHVSRSAHSTPFTHTRGFRVATRRAQIPTGNIYIQKASFRALEAQQRNIIQGS